jgi:hypothetical protein
MTNRTNSVPDYVKPGSRCRLSRAYNLFGETPGVRKLEWGGIGEGEFSLRATWSQGGRDRTTQEEGFQVKRDSRKEGIGKGNWQRETSKGNNEGLRHNLAC